MTTKLTRETMYKCPGCNSLYQRVEDAVSCCSCVEEVEGVGCPICRGACENIASICCTPTRIMGSMKWWKDHGVGGASIERLERLLEKAKEIDWDNLTVGD